MSKYTGKSGFCYYNTAVNISDANVSEGVVTVDTSTVHGLAQYDFVYITGVGGMTDLDGLYRVESVVDTDSFTVNQTTEQTYTSGGTVRNAMSITDWAADIEADSIDVTDSSSATAGWEEAVPGGWSRAKGTVSGFVLDGHNRPPMGSSITMQLNYDSTDYWSGSVILATQTVNQAIKGTDAVKVAYSFAGTGEFAETVN